MTLRAFVRLAAIAALTTSFALAAVPSDAAAARARKSAKRPAKKTVQPAPKKIVLAQTDAVAVPDPIQEVAARDPWQTARDMADRGQPDSALAVLREVLASDPLDFGLRWLEAGILNDAGRHSESAVAFDRLVAEFPDRADELLSDRAEARFDAGDARGAAADLQEWLVDHPEDTDARRRLGAALVGADDLPGALAAYEGVLVREPHEKDAELERARVLGWMGRHRDAIEAYEALLAREPGLAEAELGLARNESWDGQNRRASRHLEAIVARDPNDAEAWKALAHARYWDEDPDGAVEALARQQALDPDDAEAKALSARIAREQRARIELGHGRSDDSDGLDVRSPTAEMTWPLATGTTAIVAWQNDLTEDDGGSSSAQQLSGGLRHSWGPEFTGYARGAITSWASGSGASRGGELGAIVRPTDRVRLEVVTAREPVLTRISMEENISMLQWVFAADWDATSRLLFSASGRAGSYSDGNRSERTSFSGRWQFRDDARWEVNGRLSLEQLNVHEELDNGYYDPDFYREWGPEIEVALRPEPRWRLSSSLQTGWQQEKGSARDPYYGFEGGVEWMPNLDWTIALAGGHGDSNLQSASGYRRGWWRVGLVKAF